MRLPLLAGALVAAAAVSVFAAGRPDPNLQAMQDGCVRDYLATIRRESPTWVYVNDRDTKASEAPPPPRWLRGVVDGYYPKDLGVHPTPEDVPLVHHSYDFNFDVKPDPLDGYLLGVGNFAGRSPQSRRIHVEREQLALPMFAWPELGDHVALLGNWIWDCGHWSGGASARRSTPTAPSGSSGIRAGRRRAAPAASPRATCSCRRRRHTRASRPTARTRRGGTRSPFAPASIASPTGRTSAARTGSRSSLRRNRRGERE